MKFRTLTDLFTKELADLLSAEDQTIAALDAAFAAAASPELREALQNQQDETKEHLGRLKMILSEYPAASSGEEGEAMEGLIAEMDEVIDEQGDELLKDLGMIAICQRIQHYKIAGYGCARNYAVRLGDDTAAEWLALTLEQQGVADQVLTQVAEALLDLIEDSLMASA